MWEACLPCFPSSFQTETRDLTIVVNGDVALAYWLWRFTGDARVSTSVSETPGRV